MNRAERPVAAAEGVAVDDPRAARTEEEGRSPEAGQEAHSVGGLRSALASALSPSRVSTLYVVALFLVLFAVWVPDLFFTQVTFKSLLYQQAVTGIVAIAFLIPFTTHNFDLTVASVLGVSSLLCTWLIVEQGLSIPVAVSLTLVLCAVIGVINGILITRFGIESIIATIATQSIIMALGSASYDGRQVLGLPEAYNRLASTQFLGIAMPFYYLMIVALVAWYVLTHTPAGRHLYAIGGSKEAARLAGVKINRLVLLAFVGSAVVAGIGGIVVSARVGAGDFAVGHAYLFPSVAAVFLGYTQVRPDTYNIWGTVLAVYVLATIVKGLQLGGAPYWLPDFTNGVALILAVGVSTHRRKRALAPQPQATAEAS